MELTAGDARNIRFSGTETSYDGTEVEDFRREVVTALEASERRASEAAAHVARLEAMLEDRSAADSTADVDAARRARDQAVQLTSRMMAEVLGGKVPTIEEGMATWQDAVILKAMAEEELAAAREEARRLRETAAAEVTALRAATRAGLDDEVRTTLDNATHRAATMTAAAEEEVRRLDRRLSQLRTALRDAESRIRSLTGDALTELRMLGDLLALETEALDEIESLNPAPGRVIDLADPDPVPTPAPTPEPAAAEEPPGAAASAFVRRLRERDETAGQGFYERRLAGLRERLERNNVDHGHEG